MFLPGFKFFQKAIIFHPGAPTFLALKRAAYDPVRPGLWDLPGGNVRRGELHHVALGRELLEETALTVTDLRPVRVMTAFFVDGDLYTLFIGYCCRATTDAVTLTGEHDAYRWVAKEDFLALPSTPYLESWLKETEL